MQLLLTAELHYRLSWFKWLEAQAVRYDAIALCGDLLDVFYKEPLKRQVQRTTSWLRTLSGKTHVALCSGNHDTIDIPVQQSDCSIPAWLAGLDSAITIDGHSAIIREEIIVTSLGFVATAAQKRLVLEAGHRLRVEKGLPWIVLHHHTPAFHQGIGPEEVTAGRLLKQFSPNFWASGRLFGQHPFLERRAWVQRLSGSIVLNTPQHYAGQQLLESPFPSHLVLDLGKRELTWHCAFQDKVDREAFDLGEPGMASDSA